ncbi:helix-hairpin-helix domain-containing protein [Daejeonella sp.]|uniref:helix-hairpin-helix domain-containing protein n=1 Tax=Daejeonella sp. TaxID=2805397 RepID=UPI00398342A2
MNKQLSSYFSFSKRELNGILILLFLVSLILAYPFYYRLIDEQEQYDLTQFQEEIALFEASAVKRRNGKATFKKDIDDRIINPQYFEFDPNSASTSEWHRLGLSQKQIRVVQNYLTKGGKFYRTEDLKKIYSISEEQYKQLEPYIQIKADKPSSFRERNLSAQKYKGTRVKKNSILVELNSADSVMLDQLRGIGPAFASRIIRFRNRLGGFYRKEQLKEVYGMDSLRYSQVESQMIVNSTSIKRMKLNNATFDELRHHPYLTFKQINAIIQFRKQHGKYNSTDDLKKVLILNEEIIRKIEPYLSFEQ